MLHSVDWKLVTDVSGQPIGPVSKVQAVHGASLKSRRKLVGPLTMGPISYAETTVTNYQFTLRNIPEEPRSHNHSYYCEFNLVNFFKMEMCFR
jgi:hypothetical protein